MAVSDSSFGRRRSPGRPADAAARAAAAGRRDDRGVHLRQPHAPARRRRGAAGRHRQPHRAARRFGADAFVCGRPRAGAAAGAAAAAAGAADPEGTAYFPDSPMALEATALYRHHGRLLRVPAREVATLCDGVRMVATVQQSMRLSASRYPAIIISASGMATGGRVLHHLKARAPDERNAVVFPGFQVGGSRGARMVAGEREVKIHGEMVPVRAEVRHRGLLGPRRPWRVARLAAPPEAGASADLRRAWRTRCRRRAARGDPERPGLARARARVRRAGHDLSADAAQWAGLPAQVDCCQVICARLDLAQVGHARAPKNGRQD